MPAFRRIGDRILFAVGIVVVIGVVAVILLYAERQERSILAQNERALGKVTASTVEGLQAIMLRGYADIAHDYAARLKKVEGAVDYRILRTDGSEAFVDNLTVDRVNEKLGEGKFKRHDDAGPAPRVLAASNAQLLATLDKRRDVIYYETLPGGHRSVTVLAPIANGEKCQKCHSDNPPVRGVVKLTTSLDQVEADIQATWLTSVAVIVLGLGGIFVVVYGVAHRSLVSPIRRVTDAMLIASRGDLSVTVPVLGRDEIGRMAESFNHMSTQLLNLYSGLADEQNKLTTIILGAHEGIVLTDPAGKVVLVNPAASNLLGKSTDRIAGEGFLYLVDDPVWMEWRLAGDEEDGHSGIIEYAGRHLMVQASTIRGSEGTIIGSAAIIRDVTEEQRLQADLRRSAITDTLTGLFNRRHFDQQIGEEWERWHRYQGAFSVVLLDVDHFKKFNDTHGHDCGDRVLQAIGKLLRELGDPSAIACRYGGEELILILHERDQDAALQVAEDIRQRVAALVIDGLQVTVSIGVAGVPTHAPANADALVKRADDALYLAKEGGRNRVVGAAPAEKE